MAKFQFVMRSGPTVGKVYPLEAQELSIGRDDANRIVINDAEVSRRHARMELRGSAYVIQDLGSTNGTFVNGTRLSGIQVLNPGDTVTLGEGIVLAYESATDLNATILSTQPSQTVIERPTSAPAPPMPPETAPAKKGGSKTVIIIVVIAVVLILCLCVGVPFLADALRLDCMIPFKWFFNIIGPMFGYGLCP
ncbi:MAG: FHA domain-containing protein [Anaerolineales bacterium]